MGNVAVQTGRIVHDLHRAAAEDIGRADHDGISYIERNRFGFARRMRRSVVGLTQTETGQKPLKSLSVLRQINRIGRGTEDRNLGALEPRRQFQRRLTPELDDNAEKCAAALFDARDLDHILRRQRLEIEPVGGVVIGRHGLRIAVDHDRFDAGVAQAVGRVHAAVIELDSLADPVRSAAENDHLAPVAGIGLALRRRETVPLVAGIHVRGLRWELGGAGVDALVDRLQLQPASPLRNGLLIENSRACRAWHRKSPSASGAGKPCGPAAALPGAPAPQPPRSRGSARGTRARTDRQRGFRLC